MTEVASPSTPGRDPGPGLDRARQAPWWATASTMPPRWPRPEWGSRWAGRARTWPWRRRTWPSWATTFRGCRSPWPSAGPPDAFSGRTSGSPSRCAYFSLAPFMGAAVAVSFFGEPTTGPLLVAGSLMGAGAWLHLTECHEHDHSHEAVVHVHAHVHDEHHGHEHLAGAGEREPHAHEHAHGRLIHRHPHYPDIHHRHGHEAPTSSAGGAAEPGKP
jgi:hypothetical protein